MMCDEDLSLDKEKNKVADENEIAARKGGDIA